MSKVCYLFINQAPRLWKKRWEAQTLLEVQCEAFTVSDRLKLPCHLLVLVQYVECALTVVLNSTVNAFLPENPRSLYSSHLQRSFMKILMLVFTRNWHIAKANKCWFNDQVYLIGQQTCLTLTLWRIWCIFKRKMTNTQPNYADKLKAAI